jgi:Fe-S cluster assembly protein SufD
MSPSATARAGRAGRSSTAMTALTEAWASLPTAAGELARLREDGWSVFSEAGFPTLRDEAWKYTALRRIERRAFRQDLPVEAPGSREIAALLAEGLEGPLLVFLNGRYVPALSSPGDGDAVRIDSLAAALRDDAGAASRWGTLAEAGSHRFAALNQAFLGEGARIATTEGSEVEQPVYVVFLSVPAAEPVACHPRLVIEAAANSSLTLVEHYVGLGGEEQPNENLTNAVTELWLAPGARVEHYRVQREDPASHHVGGLFAELMRDARLASHNVNLGAALARQDLDVALIEPGAEVLLNGLYYVDGRRHTDVHTRVDHRAPHTRSEEEYRGIVTGRGRAVFNGKAVIHKDAQKSDVRQSNANLILSEHAEVDTKPELEIYADDVKASHGATVGQLDEAAFFYLLSRGLDRESARALLTFAFAETVIERLGLAPVRNQLEHAIAGALPVSDLVTERS